MAQSAFALDDNGLACYIPLPMGTNRTEHAEDTARLMALVDEEPVCRGALGTVETNNAPAEMLSVKKRPDISSRFQRVS